MFSSCHSLRCVHLRRCLCVDDACVRTLAEQCPSLEVVNLHGCEWVGDEGVEALAQHSAELRSLDLSKTAVRGGMGWGRVGMDVWVGYIHVPLQQCAVCPVQVSEEAIITFATGASRTKIKV